MSRQATPDILGSLMGDSLRSEENSLMEQKSNKTIKPESNTPVKEGNSKTIKQEIVKAVKKESNKTIPTQLLIDGTEQPIAIVEEEIKEKATFNLPVKLLGELEDKCHEIRKMCGSKQVSKTLLVEEALKMAFSEFDLQKHIGKFYSRLVNNKAVKQ